MADLESEFERMCQLENMLGLWNSYTTAKSRLGDSYFPYIRDALPWRTKHGIDHVNRIVEKLHCFLIRHLPLEGISKERTIDVMNLSLLMNSALWHDIGNIYGRAAHEQNIVRVFESMKSVLYDTYFADWIAKVAEAHCNEDSINRVIDRKTVLLDDALLYPQFVAALLRISDEIEEDHRRIEERLLPDVPKENEAYWKFCSANEAIVPAYIDRTFGTKTETLLKICVAARFDVSELWALWGKESGAVRGIEEYISRIQKINEERKYCNQFLTQTLYFHRIESIDLRIGIQDGKKRTGEITFEFDDQNGSDEFFNDDEIRATLDKCKHEEV